MATITVAQTLEDYRNFLHRIYKPPNDFYAFGLISLGFDFIGRLCHDNYTPEMDYNPTPCIRKAFDMLTDGQYKKVASEIASSIRNGFLHSLRPKGHFVLYNRQSANHLGKVHLEKYKYGSKTLVCLVIEDFLADFDEACKRLISMSENGTIKNKYLHAAYIQTALKDEIEVIVEIDSHTSPEFVQQAQICAQLLRLQLAEIKDASIDYACYISLRQKPDGSIGIQPHGFDEDTLNKMTDIIRDFLGRS